MIYKRVNKKMTVRLGVEDSDLAYIYIHNKSVIKNAIPLVLACLKDGQYRPIRVYDISPPLDFVVEKPFRFSYYVSFLDLELYPILNDVRAFKNRLRLMIVGQVRNSQELDIMAMRSSLQSVEKMMGKMDKRMYELEHRKYIEETDEPKPKTKKEKTTPIIEEKPKEPIKEPIKTEVKKTKKIVEPKKTVEPKEEEPNNDSDDLLSMFNGLL